MSLYSTKPEKELSAKEFVQLVKDKDLKIGSHALDHLSNAQRSSFEEKELTRPLVRETPRKVYLQVNKRYAVYYRKKKGFRKIIVSIEQHKAVIVSFMDVDGLPKIKL